MEDPNKIIDKTVLRVIELLVKKHSNDMVLGRELRSLINNLNNKKK